MAAFLWSLRAQSGVKTRSILLLKSLALGAAFSRLRERLRILLLSPIAPAVSFVEPGLNLDISSLKLKSFGEKRMGARGKGKNPFFKRGFFPSPGFFFPPFPSLPAGRVFALLLVLALAFSSGCVRKPGGGGSTAQTGWGKPAEVQLFTPFDEMRAVAISPQEAESLSLKMSPSVQGLRSWRDLDFAVSQSLAYASSRPSGLTAVSQPGLLLTYGDLARNLAHLKSLLPRLDAFPGLLAKEFTWYRIGPDFGFTGYYEPTLEASRTKSNAYPYPLYKLPPDIRKGVPYFSRNEIDRKGALAGRGLELCWVSSETDAFFLHIQGSGRLRYVDGTVTHALYAGKNNQSYVPLGRVLRDEGLIAPDKISMQSIRQCLLENPKRQAEFFDRNPSYVFFREADRGPLGAMGRPLTPWVSTATDRNTLPHGSLTFVVLPLPDQTGRMRLPFYGLTLPQDTGGAIKGNRIDLFCGPGDMAQHTAGYLNVLGAVYILVKK